MMTGHYTTFFERSSAHATWTTRDGSQPFRASSHLVHMRSHVIVTTTTHQTSWGHQRAQPSFLLTPAPSGVLPQSGLTCVPSVRGNLPGTVEFPGLTEKDNRGARS